MLIATIDTIFAAIFYLFARRSLPRGVDYLRYGWMVVDTEVNKPGFRDNTESRRAISEGGTYLISGLLWCGGGLLAAYFAVAFALHAVRGVVSP